jgi:hypothetical protein
MVKRLALVVLAVAAAAATLAYLRDPPWLIDQATGLRRWERPAGDLRYRWSSGHASFFVRSDARAIEIPVSTTFDEPDSQPMMVTVSLDGEVAGRVILTAAGWTRVKVGLPAPGSRRVRRIDIRTNVVRPGNRGVRVGDVDYLH